VTLATLLGVWANPDDEAYRRAKARPRPVDRQHREINSQLLGLLHATALADALVSLASPDVTIR
jgi:hypothetical protein